MRKTAIIVIPIMLILLFTGCGRAVNRIEAEKPETGAESIVQEETKDQTGVNENGEDETRENKTGDNAEISATLSEDNQEEDTERCDDEESIVVEEEYSNPIDAYFLPRIENASCEAERRQMQDTYRGVWKTEFENIMAWMQDKCVYQEDRDTLLLYEESVVSLIETTRTISLTKYKYEFPPDSDERNSWGNGTRSYLNQKEAEMYRNAGMELIDDTYTFMERDYSMELYE